ncbi:hypothetical protein NQ314_009283 [Rhamnusium bicolor]|uniref:Uncharacterized protein n=1 Tax=Rhamnusium bicolor TaxID=1586634 RepID=A0AAV8Y2Q2_9CUCU|nr:hypothetical protein NQ314_009283 [Rhamnusium bicolor]
MPSGEESLSDVDNDLEIIEEGREEQENFENQELIEEGTNENAPSPENAQNADDENKKVVKPKRVIKNPQPKLNEQTLKGPKGLAAIESYFEQ